MMFANNFNLSESDYGQRVDVLIAAQVQELSRGFIKRLAAEDKLLVDGKPVSSGYKIRQGAKILSLDYDLKELQNIPIVDLDILYEDKDILAINKPTGLITHARGRYWNEASIASSIRSYQIDQTDVDVRAGIVHRLDRATSGVILCAKTKAAHLNLQAQFSDRRVSKEYRAVTQYIDIPTTGNIDKPIARNPKKPVTFMVSPNGKNALTNYSVIDASLDRLLFSLKPVTGRTHQLRVHLSSIGAPIIGDGLYGGLENNRLMLHAYRLTLEHPSTGEVLNLEAPLPKEFRV